VIRLLPRSLFGRLVLVMLAGLLTAQLITLYINTSERDRLLYRSGGMYAAQRIAELAAVLDSMPSDERRKLTAIFDGPPLAIDLDRAPLAAPPEDAGADLQLAMFTTMLRRGLAEDVPVVVVRAPMVPGALPPVPPRRPGAMAGMMGHRMMGFDDAMPMPPPGGADFIVQVGLRDGTVATFNSYLSQQATSVPLRIALTLLALLLLVGALSLIAVRWITVPLRTLATAAEQLGRDIHRPPLPEDGPAEVRQAAKAFNTMQERLTRFIAERGRTFAAMSHDLKTPITRMRLRTELLDDEGLRTRFDKDLDEMQAMVTQTLEYMRDETVQEAQQRIDVNALLESMQNDYQESGGQVDVKGSAAGPYVGRPLALRRCITNLLDNALRYGGRATVVIDDQPSVLTLRVQDQGPGMPQEQLDRAFEPFFRGEASRSRATGGTGLGLGIARNIARAHGGDILLRNRSEGGFEAVLMLGRNRSLIPARQAD
jgi:signal transduction histidine kinase